MSHVVLMVFAEIRKVFSRGSGIAVLAASVVVPFGCVAALWEVVNNAGPSINGQPLSSMVTASAVQAGAWTLTARNFLLVPIFLIFATASAFGGEIGDRTLREVLVRPVARPVVLAVRVVALSVLAAVSQVLTFVLAVGMGLAVWGLPTAPLVPEAEPGLGALALGYGASILGDIGLIVVVMVVSLWIRSVGGTLAAVVLVLMGDFLFRQLLNLLGLAGVATAERLAPWTLGNALGAWSTWGEGLVPARFAALAVVIAAGCALAILRFRRLDIP